MPSFACRFASSRSLAFHREYLEETSTNLGTNLDCRGSNGRSSNLATTAGFKRGMNLDKFEGFSFTGEGIKGKLKFTSSDDLSPIEGNKVVIDIDSYTLFTVESIKNRKIEFTEVKSIGEAKRLTNHKMFVLKKDLDMFDYALTSELIDTAVYFKDKKIGTIESVSDFKSYLLLNVKGDREYNIPMIDKFVESYDRGRKSISLKVSEDQF